MDYIIPSHFDTDSGSNWPTNAGSALWTVIRVTNPSGFIVYYDPIVIFFLVNELDRALTVPCTVTCCPEEICEEQIFKKSQLKDVEVIHVFIRFVSSQNPYKKKEKKVRSQNVNT